jgi:hypothetical protein
VIAEWRRAQVLPIFASLLALLTIPVGGAVLEMRAVRRAAVQAVEREEHFGPIKVLWTLQGRTDSGQSSKYTRLVCTKAPAGERLVLVDHRRTDWGRRWRAVEVAQPGRPLSPPNEDAHC